MLFYTPELRQLCSDSTLQKTVNIKLLTYVILNNINNLNLSLKHSFSLLDIIDHVIMETMSFLQNNGEKIQDYSQPEQMHLFNCFYKNFINEQNNQLPEKIVSYNIQLDHSGIELQHIINDFGEFEENMISSIFNTQLIDILKQVLTEKEYLVLILRLGFDSNHPLTQREISIALGIPQGAISRLERMIFSKLKRISFKLLLD